MLPPIVEKKMNKLCSSLSVRTGNIQSIYVYGSVALGDFIEGTSDIDFIVVLKHIPDEADIQAISEAHVEVEAEIPGTVIMGAYLLEDDLGRPADDISTLLTYYNNKLQTNHTGADVNPITWWILKNHGIRVCGAELSFSYDLETNSMIKYVIENLNTYWVSNIERLENQLLSEQEIPVEQLDEAVEWCTLGMLRQLYTIRKQDIKSKAEAGYYGLETMPPRWHGLIQEAIHIKRLRPDRCYTSQLERITDLIALLRYIHSEANLEMNIP
jgi:predicted nucleotidyltransferase